MPWLNKGQIFNIDDWKSASGKWTYAQSPQAIVFHDRVRIYFSSRSKEHESELWISRPRFIDMNLDLTEFLSEPVEVSYAPGDLGQFDEHGIFPFSPVHVGDEIWAYTTGWSRRASVSVETAIGLMKSNDGITFSRYGLGPVLSSQEHEPFLVCDGFVWHLGRRWLMWYIFGTKWELVETSTGMNAERIYKIGVAWSDDGMHWNRNTGKQIISDYLGEGEAQALPSVIQVGNQFQMAFCYRNHVDFRSNPSNAYRLGFASSRDGMSWTRDDSKIYVPRLDFDAEMQCYPHLFLINQRRMLLFNGNNFGRDGFGLAEFID